MSSTEEGEQSTGGEPGGAAPGGAMSAKEFVLELADKLTTPVNLTKPILKLIETAGVGVGKVYEPTATRRQAKADADAMLTRTKAEIERERLLARSRRRIEDDDA